MPTRRISVLTTLVSSRPVAARRRTSVGRWQSAPPARWRGGSAAVHPLETRPPERDESAAGVRRPDAHLRRAVRRRVRRHGRGDGTVRSRGRWSRFPVATSSSPRSRAACASCRAVARSASPSPACRPSIRAGRAACSTSRSARPSPPIARSTGASPSRAQGGNGTSVARGTLAPDRRSLTDVRVIFRVLPSYDDNMHYGSRLAFGPDGMLYVTDGERSDPTRRVRTRSGSTAISARSSHPRPTARCRRTIRSSDGRREAGDLVGRPSERAGGGVRSRTDSSGQVEHGTNGGDELNRIEKGKNYGWAEVGYGVEYSGAPAARSDGEEPAPSSRSTTGIR